MIQQRIWDDLGLQWGEGVGRLVQVKKELGWHLCYLFIIRWTWIIILLFFPSLPSISSETVCNISVWYSDIKHVTLRPHLHPHPELVELNGISPDSKQCIGLDDAIVLSSESLVWYFPFVNPTQSNLQYWILPLVSLLAPNHLSSSYLQYVNWKFVLIYHIFLGINLFD